MTTQLKLITIIIIIIIIIIIKIQVSFESDINNGTLHYIYMCGSIFLNYA